MSNFKSIGQGVRGLRPPEIGGFPLTLNVALTTVLRTNVLHCEKQRYYVLLLRGVSTVPRIVNVISDGIIRLSD